MAETEQITVATIERGAGEGTEEPGTTVDLPVVDILTGRGFVTGKSGSGKSNTASVIIENLLSANFPVLIVDTDGEYYGLKQEFEMLHVGGDDECDIQVSPNTPSDSPRSRSNRTCPSSSTCPATSTTRPPTNW